MPEEIITPKNLANTEPRETAPKPVTPTKRRPRATSAKKPAGQKITKKNTETPKIEVEKISRELNAIYQEPDGSFPNMKTIQKRRSYSIFNILVGLLVFGVIFAVGVWGYLFWSGSGALPVDSVQIAISGPTTAAIGVTSTYTIAYNNTGSEAISKVVLNVYPPAGFIFVTSSLPSANNGNNEWHVPTVPARGKGFLTITAIPYGDIDSAVSWRAFIHYEPEKFNSTLEAVSTLPLTLTTSPVTLAVSGPNAPAVGNSAAYTFTLKGGFLAHNAKVELAPILPSTFVISSSTPNLKNGRFAITLPAQSTSTQGDFIFTVRGAFTAPSATATTVGAALLYTFPQQNIAYTVAKTELPVAVAENAVAVTLAINGSVTDFEARPGDILAISVRAKNNSASAIKNAVVKLKLDAPTIKKLALLDWAEIQDQLDGTIIGQQVSEAIRRGTITWTKKELPALAELKQNSDAIIDLRIPLRTGQGYDLSALTTSTILAESSLTYTDKSGANQNISAAPLKITVNSDLNFEARNESAQTQTGQNQYALLWVLTNSFHELKNITITASVFGDANVSIASSTIGAVSFNPKDKTIIWQIDRLPISVDVASFPFGIILNKINPSQTALVSKVHITAEDSATGRKIDFLSEETLVAPVATSSNP